MTTLSAVPSFVNPTAAASAVALGRARCPITGRFVSFTVSWGVQTVALPNGVIAYRVGPIGQIFAKLADAKRAAAARRPGYLAPPEPIRKPSAVFTRGWDAPAAGTYAARPFGVGLVADASDLADFASAMADRYAVASVN